MSYPSLPPQYCEHKLTITLCGKDSHFKDVIGHIIFNLPVPKSTCFQFIENDTFKIIIAPDFFGEENQYSHQQIVNFMTHNHRGPNLFILTVDSQNCQDEEVIAQIIQLQNVFGKHVTDHLAVITHNVEIYYSLRFLEKRFSKIKVVTGSETLPAQCKSWTSDHRAFHFQSYSRDVNRRQNYRSSRREKPCSSTQFRASEMMVSPSSLNTCAASTERSLQHNYGDNAVEENVFNIILLGQTGTGKSASGNTILSVLTSHLEEFKCQPSVTPVTTKCETRTVKKNGRVLRVVDTPDFLNEQLDNSQAQVEECKKYCKAGQCVVLLVIQLGRFTESEVGVLEKLEDKLGWRFRKNTIVLLTHGENFSGDLRQFINERSPLKHIVDECGQWHLFKNTSRDRKQVIALMNKFSNLEMKSSQLRKINAQKKSCMLS